MSLWRRKTVRPHNVFDTFNGHSGWLPFAALADLLDNDCPAWLTAGKDELDQAYVYHHATAKEISRYAEILLEGDPSHPTGREDVYNWTDDSLQALMKIFWTHYGDNIERIRTVLTAQYAPLDNYNMTETRTPNLTETTQTKSNVRTSGSNKVYGFNSSTAVPATESQADTVTQGADSANQSTRTNTGTEKLERSGNIGVTTSQQMLLSELDLRAQHEFEEYLFTFLDQIMTCGAYTHGVTDFQIIH